MCSNYSAHENPTSVTNSRVFPKRLSSVFIALSIVIVALTHSALSQDTSKIPTLQLWYEAKGISFVNYLENYDVANGGNALIVSKQSRPQLWFLNNNSIDTTTRDVPECDPYWVGQADLNGDGIQEMIDWRANVFTRTAQGAPYNLKAVQRYSQVGKAFFYGRKFIDDFTGDGKQDFMGEFGTDSIIGKILIGGDDLTKLRVLTLPKVPNSAYSLQYIVGAWKDNDGSNKIVLYQQTDTSFTLRTEAFFLYSFRIEGDKVSYTALDTTTFKDFKDKWTPYYYYQGCHVWHSKLSSSSTLITASFSNTDFYVIRDNKFIFKWNKKSKPGCLGILEHSLFNTKERGTVFGWVPFAYLYDGNPADDTTARAWLPLDFEDIHSIADVNNDGVSDFATVSPTYQNMKIYLGRDSKLNVDNIIPKTFDARIIGENPLRANTPLQVELTLENSTSITMTLYNLRGQVVQVMYSGKLHEGKQILTIPISTPLQSGMYSLRISNDKQIIDKGLIITE